MEQRIPCAICKVDDTRPFLRRFDLQIVRCRRCGLIYTCPRLSPDDIWRRYSAEYFREEYLPALGVHRGRFDLEQFDRRYGAMLGWLEIVWGGQGSLLEVGAGAGFFAKAADRAGWKVTGLEISSEALAFARDELGLDMRQGSTETMDFPEHAFDVVVMFDVAEHLLEPLEAFRAVQRVLRPGGLLAISTPNVRALSGWALGPAWKVLSPAEHLYYYSERTLKRLLNLAGFTDVHFERKFQGHGVLDVMNPKATHDPLGWRARSYGEFVYRLGIYFYRLVQWTGRGDIILCAARVPEGS